MAAFRPQGFSLEDFGKSESGNYLIPISEIGKMINFHPIVADNPKYFGTPKYEALKHSIDSHGYDSKKPISIYHKRIVDGWHRTTACQELGLSFIEAEELPYRMTIEEVQEEVIRGEIGRQMSKSELAIKAWKKWQDGTYKSVAQAALNIGTTQSGIKAVSYVAKHGNVDWIDSIYKGEEVRYGDALKTTDNIFTIKAHLEKAKKNGALLNAMRRNYSYKKMTDEEMDTIKKQLGEILTGKFYEDIENLSSYIFNIGKDEKKKFDKMMKAEIGDQK